MANIVAVKEIFGNETLSIPCLFHLINSWWRKASKRNLRKKEYVINIRALIFNLEIIPFLTLNNAKTFYTKIKNYYNEECYQEFYQYFESTWLPIEDNINSKFDTNLRLYSRKFNIVIFKLMLR